MRDNEPWGGPEPSEEARSSSRGAEIAARMPAASAPTHTRANTSESEATQIADGPASEHTWSESGASFEDDAPGLPVLAGVPRPGDRVGQTERYEVIRELGRGGMGAVLLARDTVLGRPVAIKFLHSHRPEVTTRFILEARATARCSHENIIVIHEVGEHDGHPFMVLEYLEGSPLSALIEDRALPPARAVELVIPVVRALECAHAHDIVHRDLKPANVFVTDAGAVKVLDFGIAKLLQADSAPGGEPGADRGAKPGGEPGGEPGAKPGADHDADHDDHPVAAAAEAGARPIRGQSESVRDPDMDPERTERTPLTRRGALVGTLPYMSPEQWRGGAIDHRADLWAVGIMLFRMVAGRHPLHPREGRELMITGLLEFPMPSVREACPELPDELADVIDRCLRKPLDQRVGSARELLAALEPLAGTRDRRLRADESPYAGLRAFQESDANRFFGRGREISLAVNRLADHPLLGVIGPSGVGKSSFVRAGVIPALKHSGQTWSSLIVRPGRDPLVALARAIAPLARHTDTLASDATAVAEIDASEAVTTEIAARLYEQPGALGAILRAYAQRRGRRILVFVDQLEELYTLGADAATRAAFTACLAGAADDPSSPIRVAVSIRSDFLDRVAEDERFAGELSRGLLFLLPPGREALREAIAQPAELAGHEFESQAVIDDMLDHLAEMPGALPLLQFAASQLWDRRDRKRRLLTDSAYRAIGGVAGALAAHADATVRALPAAALPLLRELFLRLVTAERTRALVPLRELAQLGAPGEVARLVDHLVAARLLVVHTADASGAHATHGDGAVELVHESLIDGWPALARWLDVHAEDAAFLDQLRTAARQWEQKRHAAGTLWRGEAADEARRFVRRWRGELTGRERAYLDAVLAFDARAARRRRIAVGTTIGVLVATVVAAVAALVWIRDAEQRAREQARQAEQARAELSARFEEYQRAQRDKEAARLEMERAQNVAEEAREMADTAQREQALTYEELLAKKEALERTVRRARRAERNERAARRQAEDSAALERAAKQALERKRARDRERIAELERELGVRWIKGPLPGRTTAGANEADGDGDGDGSPASAEDDGASGGDGGGDGSAPPGGAR